MMATPRGLSRPTEQSGALLPCTFRYRARKNSPNASPYDQSAQRLKLGAIINFKR